MCNELQPEEKLEEEAPLWNMLSLQSARQIAQVGVKVLVGSLSVLLLVSVLPVQRPHLRRQ